MTTYTLEELTPDELAALERYRKERDSDNQYTPWLEQGISEIQYYHRLYLEMSHETARLTEFVETLATTPCEKYTSGDCQENGRTATAKYAAFRMCYPCQARAARVQAAAPGEGDCKKCGQSTHWQGGEYPCPVCGVQTMHDDLQNGCAHTTPMPAGNGKMYCKDCGKYI